jgi:general secretion pathway protein M
MKTALHTSLRAPLGAFWKARTPIERIAIIGLSVVVAVLLYFWLVQSATHARAQLKISVPQLKAQAVRVEQQAAEYERLRNKPATTASQTDLRELVQAQVDAAGLSRSLIRIDAKDANQIQVVFGDVAFPNWLNWVENLVAQRVRLDSSRIEASTTPGLVNVTATVTRPAAK